MKQSPEKLEDELRMAREFVNGAQVGSFVDDQGNPRSGTYLLELARKLEAWARDARVCASLWESEIARRSDIDREDGCDYR